MTAPHLYDVKKGKKDSVVSFIQNAFEHHKTRMRSIHRVWALNLAWVKGHQNVDFDKHTLRFRSRDRKEWQTQLISNLMLPIQRANVARLATVAPVWDVVPATPDEEDIQISRVSKMILDHLWLDLDLPQKLLRLLFWQSTCSNAYIKIGWNPDIGEDLQVNSQNTQEDLLTQLLELRGLYETPKLIDVKAGNVFLDIIPPFNLAWDPLAAVFTESPWCIETNIRSLDWVVDNFGNKYKEILTEDSDLDILLHPYMYDEDQSVPRKGIITHEFFVKETNKFKKGLYCLVAQNEVLVTPKDHPYDHKLLPYTHFMEIFTPGSQFGTCAVEQVRPNQARYNAIQSTVTDCINVLGKPKWLVANNSQVQEISNAPNEIIFYRFPLKPEQIQPKPLPGYIQQTMEQIRGDMQDTSSLQNVSQGQNEPGLRSGRAVLALQSSDDEQQGPTLIWYDTALRQTGVQVLRLMNQFVTEERIIQITGEFNELETLTYSGAMLQGQNKGDYYNVRVNTYARNFMSRAGRENLLINMTQMGLLNPQTDKTLMLNMLGLANTTSLFDELATERARQWREIQTMSQGEAVEVKMGENHEQHLMLLKKFMASSRRDRLEPDQIKLIQDHLVGHKRMQVIEALHQQIIAQGIMQNARGTDSTAGSGETTRGTEGADKRTQTGVNTTTS